MIKVAVLNHHGRTPGGSENSLLLLLKPLKNEMSINFVIFERGEFFDQVTEAFGHADIVPMSASIAMSTRSRASVKAVIESFSLLIRLVGQLRSIKPDIVITNSMKAHVVGSIAAFIVRARCINFWHDLPEGRAFQLTKLISRLFAHSRIACSKAVADHFGLPNTSVVHPPIVLAKYQSLPTKSEARASLGLESDGIPTISLVGRIARWKGQDRFIRIAALVNKQHDARFLIVGGPVFGVDDDYLPELHKQSQDLGMTDRVTFIPWTDDLRDVYAVTDLAVNCSTREPFGRTTLEALASGVPNVCFNDGGTPEAMISGESGIFVEPGDEEAFSEALLVYLQSSERLQRAKIAAVEDAAQFDVAGLSQKFRQLILTQAKGSEPIVELLVARDA